MEDTLLDKETIDIMEFRIQQEHHSSRLYHAMELWFKDRGYNNLAKLYSKYVEDELVHMKWAESFLLDYNLKPKLKALPSPEMEFETPMDIFEETLLHEKLVTKQVEELTGFALSKKNFVLYALGLKYCAEQQEELGKSWDIISVAKLTNDMLVLDNYIGENYLD